MALREPMDAGGYAKRKETGMISVSVKVSRWMLLPSTEEANIWRG